MNCKCCGAWFSSSDASQELCAACRRALARVSKLFDGVERVRYEGDTTFIATTNLEGYANRIIVGQGTQCKVYYVDEDARHGRWVLISPDLHGGVRPKCSICGKYRLSQWTDHIRCNFCPNCGAKMDLEVQDD